MQTQEDFQLALADIKRVIHLERNQDLRDCHQDQLAYVQQSNQQGVAAELQQLWLNYIESYEYSVSMEEKNLNFSAHLRALVDYYVKYPEQRADMIQIFLGLNKIDAAYRYSHHVGRGVRTLKTACHGVEQAELLKKRLASQQLPVHVADLLHNIEQYAAYTSTQKCEDYRALKAWSKDKLTPFSDAERVDIWSQVLHVLVEIDRKNLSATELHYDQTLLQKHFLVLFGLAAETEDLSLFEEQNFIYLVEHFQLLMNALRDRKLVQVVTKMVTQKAKKKQLTPALIAALEKLSLVELGYMGSLPAKQLEKYQQKIRETLQAYQADATPLAGSDQQNAAGLETYVLPFLDDTNVFQIGAVQGASNTAWIAELQTQYQALPNDQKQQWFAFWQLMDAAKSAKPTKKWLSEAESIWQNHHLVQAGFLDLLQHLWQSIEKTIIPHHPPFNVKNENTLKAMLWFSQLQHSRQDELLNILTRVSELCYRKISGIGATNAVIGGVALNALARRGLAGLAKLSFLQKKIRYELGQKVIRKALNDAAEINQLTVAEIKEVVAEDFGFVAGQSTERVLWGDYQLGLACVADSRCETMLYQDQQLVTDLPKGLQSSTTYKNLKKQADAIQRQCRVYALNFEEHLLNARQWSYDFWQQHVLAHGILGWLAQRLIWQLYLVQGESLVAMFDADKGGWHDASGQMLVVDAAYIEHLSLWHPIHASVADVQAWRAYCMQKHIQQPFKQAFREVYVATQEELNDQQSLRFAYHYLQQSKFRAVATARGWHYNIQGGWDNVSMPSRYFSGQQIVAILRVDFPQDSQLLTSTGVYAYIKTQEIVFRNEQGQQQNIADVSKIAFSEAMRDIDYFIQGCSIGLDHALELTGFPVEMTKYYLQRYRPTTSQIVANRQQSLDLILSKLNIAEQCAIDDRFVYVKGQLHAYKIHLATGHVFIESNDQYVCIVPQKKLNQVSVEHLFLPFEDDAMLSLILSKVLLLSRDADIRDELIQEQIKVA